MTIVSVKKKEGRHRGRPRPEGWINSTLKSIPTCPWKPLFVRLKIASKLTILHLYRPQTPPPSQGVYSILPIPPVDHPCKNVRPPKGSPCLQRKVSELILERKSKHQQADNTTSQWTRMKLLADRRDEERRKTPGGNGGACWVRREATTARSYPPSSANTTITHYSRRHITQHTLTSLLCSQNLDTSWLSHYDISVKCIE